MERDKLIAHKEELEEIRPKNRFNMCGLETSVDKFVEESHKRTFQEFPKSYAIKLVGLEQSQKYTIRVNTILNGKVMAYRSEMIEAVNENVEKNFS